MDLDEHSMGYYHFYYLCYFSNLLLTRTEKEIREELNANEYYSVLFAFYCILILEENNFTALIEEVNDDIKRIVSSLRFDKYQDQDIKRTVIAYSNHVIEKLNTENQKTVFEKREDIKQYLMFRNEIYNYPYSNNDSVDVILCNIAMHYDCLNSISLYEDYTYFKGNYAYLEVINFLVKILDFENENDRKIFDFVKENVLKLVNEKASFKDKKYVKYLLITYNYIINIEKEKDSRDGKLKRRDLQ